MGTVNVEGDVVVGQSLSNTAPVYVGGRDPSGNLAAIELDALGRLPVTSATPGTPGTHNEDSLALAAQTSDTIDTPDLAVQSVLEQVKVSGGDSFSYTVSVVNNGTATLVAGPFYSFFGDTNTWEPEDSVATVAGGTGGLDAFRVEITNQAKNKPADYNVFISYRQ